MKRTLMPAVMLLVLVAGQAVAGEYSPNDGRLLASNCFQCHGVDGNPTAGGFDGLAGEDDITSEIIEMSFKAKSPSVDREEEIMRVHAYAIKNSGNGNTAELRALSAYLAGVPPTNGGDGDTDE